MGIISGLLRLVGLGFLADTAETLGADDAVKGMAKNYAKDKATGYAKDKAMDFAKGKAKGLVSKKKSKTSKSKYDDVDKRDKYWYLKDDD